MQIKQLVAIAACSAWLACAAVDLPPETVLVKKGDTQVTAGDFYASLAQLPEDQRFSYRTDVLRITSAVSSLYLARTLANEARGAGIDREPEVRARLKLAEEQLLTQIYLERFEKSIKTPDFEPRALEVYKADRARFTQPAQVQFKHILVTFQGRTHEEAKRRAEEARQKLLAGENFTRTAREYTNDPTFRGNDGVIGPAPYANLLKELAESARTSPIGQVSDLIESGEGYHVIVVEQRLPESVVTFEKAKKALIEADQEKFRRTVIGKKLADITNSKEVTLYTDELASLKTEVDRDHLRKMHEEEAAREAKRDEEAQRKEKKPEAAKKGG
jgi:parvulin-like peptidyl-prolyl isomerase